MKQSTFSAVMANSIQKVLQGYSKTIRLLLVMLLTLTASTAWGQTTTTYTFSSKSWEASPADWTSGEEGNQMQSGRGIQITTGASGANGTSPTSFTNVSKVVVTYSTNASKGAGSIAVKIGNNTEVSQDVTKTGGTTDRTLTYTFTPNQTGSVKVTVTCTTNSIYLKSVAITEATTSSPPTLSSIAVSGQTTEFTVGDAFEFGGIVTATYSDASTADVTEDATFSGYNMSEEGEQTVTVEYEGKTTTYNITVSAAAGGGGDEGGCTWELVTDVPSLAVGDEVVIAASDYDYALSTTQNSNNRGQADVTKDGDYITFESDVQVLTLEAGTTSGTWAFYTGSGYLYAASSSSNYLRTQTTNNENGSWEITISEGVATIVAQGSYTRNTMQYNNSSSIFSCYASASQKALAIYKKVCEGGSTASTYTLTLHSGLSCVTDGSATVELNATELTNFIPATRDGFTCSGYWSAPSGGVQVLNADGTFAGTNVTGYITDGKWIYEGDDTLTPHWSCSNTMTLSVGEQTNGTYTIDKTSLATCDCTESGRQVTITATPSDGYAATEITYSGNGTATKVSGPTVDGNTTKWVYRFAQGDSGSGTFTVTFETVPTYTITLNAGSGTCSPSSVEGIYNSTVTLPSASPSDACVEDGWTFAGWAEEAVSQTTTEPTLIPAGNYTITTNKTLYAVYSQEVADGGGGNDYVLTNIGDIEASDVVVITMTNSSGTTYAMSNENSTSDPPSAVSVTVSGTKLTSEIYDVIQWNIGGSADAYIFYPNGTTSNWLYCTSTNNGVRVGTNTNKTFKIDATSGYLVHNGTSRYIGIYNSQDWRCYTSVNTNIENQILSFYVKSAGGTTTYYNSNPVCVASWSITYDLDGGTGNHCTNTSVPQSDPTYTICDETPTKEGYTFLYWSDGTNTYAPSDEITLTSDITLTAVWQPNTYTVIWGNNGDVTEVPYNHGETLVIPDDPASCDGVKDFVGWTTHSGYYSATTAPDDLFTTKTATVTANATYYAVFATPGAGGTEFALGESGTFKMYANVDGTNYYAQGGVSNSKITATTNVSNASDYTLTYTDGAYTIKQGTSFVGHKEGDADLNTNEVAWTISEGTNGSWRVQSNLTTSRALSYSTSASAFKAYATSNITAGNNTYFDIEFGAGSSGYTDYTTICEQVESIVVENPQTEFYVTDDFTIGTGTVTATLSGGGTADVTALAHFSGYNMNVVGTYTITVTYMGATATYEINVKALDNAWVLTWNVSGKTNTGLGPRSVTKGSAIGTLPVPEVPAACEGKTFMGWTESNIVPSDGVGIVYITEATVPTKNTTYYAVFANINNFCTLKPIEDIESGSKVVIVAVASLTNDGGAGKAISSRATDDTYNLQGDSVAIYDETINTPHSTCIWTITKTDGKCIFEQDGKYLNGVLDGSYSNLKYLTTEDSWTLTNAASGMTMTYNMESTNATGEYIEWYNGKFAIHNEVNDQGDFDMQFYVTLGDEADITDYTTGCEEFTITYYGFRGGYSTSCSSDGVIVLPVNSEHVVPNCGDVVKDHTDLGREFLNVWMTEPHGGHTFKPGDTLILTQDTILYAQWKLETEKETTTLPTDIEDLAGTDVYVYGGTTLTLQAGSTTINTLVLKGGIQSDGSYQMPKVWVPAGATLKRNSNKIYLDLAVNAKTWYPFAVPFAAKNNQYVEYIDPTLAAASTYGTHFAIKTYDGARRATKGEDRPENWVRVLRDATLQPGVGYIISAMTYPDKDTATIRIPMTVPNTWFDNGEQAVVGTTTRNAVTVTGHTGAAATEHQRHAGWNFVASPFLSNFAGSSIGGEQGYINGWIDISDDFNYKDTDVRYVTIPAYDFAYYSQQKMSEVTLSPEWSFFVQIAADQGGTMSFATSGRQQAPAALRANSANANPSFEANIVIINEQEQTADHTGLVINDRYTPAYEIGGDLEKMFGSAYRTNIYTLSQNTRLAYNALSYNDATLPIPLGFRAAEAGEYTIQLTNPEEIVGVESIMLKDNYNNQTTNLLLSDYTFYTDKTQDDNRLVIYIVPVKNTPTDVTNIEDKTETRKVIFNHHLYIIHNGNIYNGVGQKM